MNLEKIDDRGRRLAAPAAAVWRELQVRRARENLPPLTIVSDLGAHRTRDQQELLWKRYLAGGNLAARPGESDHEDGLAFDIANPGRDASWIVRQRIPGVKQLPAEAWHFSVNPALVPESITRPDEEIDMTQLRQNHARRPDGKIVRALHAPGTGYWLEWTESGATYANAFATQFGTGDSIEVTMSLFGAMRRAANNINPRDELEIAIADAG